VGLRVDNGKLSVELNRLEDDPESGSGALKGKKEAIVRSSVQISNHSRLLAQSRLGKDKL
jgi:hypothetical protein